MTPSKFRDLTLSVIDVIDKFPRLARLLRRIHYHLREPYRVVLRRLARPRPCSHGLSLADEKESFRKKTLKHLQDFLKKGEKLVIPTSATPQVSVLLVLYNQAALTFACLESLQQERQVVIETIIVDNCSSDMTPTLMTQVQGVTYVRNNDNAGFLRAVNQAAKLAQGEYILLLNNDAVLLPGTLAAACHRLERNPKIGAVGGKIVLPDGSLQEAGSIIWRDGSCLGYGRGADPNAPEFQFVREVDYCSGAFLLIRRNLFEELGGLDEAYIPAYYEESDFCIRLRKAGYAVVYDPKAVINHFEFASAVVKDHAIAQQRRNREILLERHRDFLATKDEPRTTGILQARMVKPYKGRILVIDDRVPHPALGSGFPRAATILRKLLDFGYFVTFYPLRFPLDDWQQVYATLQEEVEVILDAGLAGFEQFMNERAGYYTHILVSRPHNMETLSLLWKKNPAIFRDVRIIYDAEAVFAIREMLQGEINGRSQSGPSADELIKQELDLASVAERILTVSSGEAAYYRNHGYKNIYVVGHAIPINATPAPFAERQGMLFVGAMHKNNSPNADSMYWFVKEVLPYLESMAGSAIELTIVGDCSSTRIPELASPHIHVLGRQDDLTQYYDMARVFIVPTRFASGIPMKAHEAAAAGVPMVVTPLIASQLGWEHDRDLLVGATPKEFAQQISRLYNNESLWNTLRKGALNRVSQDCSETSFIDNLRRAVT